MPVHLDLASLCVLRRLPLSSGPCTSPCTRPGW